MDNDKKARCPEILRPRNSGGRVDRRDQELLAIAVKLASVVKTAEKCSAMELPVLLAGLEHLLPPHFATLTIRDFSDEEVMAMFLSCQFPSSGTDSDDSFDFNNPAMPSDTNGVPSFYIFEDWIAEGHLQETGFNSHVSFGELAQSQLPLGPSVFDMFFLNNCFQ